MAPIPFVIDSEPKALIFLSGLINSEFDLEEFAPSFSNALWARLHVEFDGEKFKSTLPASAMRGLIDYQMELYRSVSWILYGDDRISRLTDDDKTQFELVFEIKSGSTNVFVEAAKFMGGLAERAVDRMSSRDFAIAGVLVAVLYFGEGGFDRFLTYHTDIAKIEQQTHKDDQMVILVREQREQTQKVIEEAAKHSEAALKIIEQNDRALAAIVKGAADSDGAVIQGRAVSKNQIRRLNESQKNDSQHVHITMLCKVARVDVNSETAIYVRCDPLDKSESVRASLSDPIIGDRIKSVVEKATYTNDTISVTLTARKKGDKFFDAKIIKAYRPRQKRSD